MDWWSGFEQEIKCLICELQLKLSVSLVFLAVNDKVFWVTTCDLAQVTADWDGPLLAALVPAVTHVTLLLLLYFRVVELLLKLKGC